MAIADDEPRASVKIECEKIIGCGVGDGDGDEESRRAEIAGYGTVKDGIAGSIVAGGGTSVVKSIGEARLAENLPCKPDASTVLPTQLTIFLVGKFLYLMELQQKRFTKSSVLLLKPEMRQRILQVLFHRQH